MVISNTFATYVLPVSFLNFFDKYLNNSVLILKLKKYYLNSVEIKHSVLSCEARLLNKINITS